MSFRHLVKGLKPLRLDVLVLCLAGLAGLGAPADAQVFPALPPETQAGASSVQNQVVASDTARSSTLVINRTIESRIFDALFGHLFGNKDGKGLFGSAPPDVRIAFAGAGLPPGDAASGTDPAPVTSPAFGAWTSPSVDFVRNDAPGADYHGHIASPLFGLDYLVPDTRAVIGLSLGYEGARFDLAAGGSYASDGFVVTPYIGYAPLDWLQFAGGVTYAPIAYRTDDRTAGVPAGATFGGNRLAGFASAKATIFSDAFGVEGLGLSTKLSTQLSHQTQDGHLTSLGTAVDSTDAYLGTVTGTVRGSYAFSREGQAFGEAYVETGASYDYRQSQVVAVAGQLVPGTDRSEGLVAAGADFQVADSISAGAEYLHVFGRSHYDSDTVTLNLRISF